MLKALQRAAKINQEGAAFLEMGQTSKALKCFRAALKQVNECCQQGLAEKLPDKGCTSFCTSTPVRLSSSESQKQDSYYSQAFHFDPQGKISVQKQSFCSAVLIFNCALALHQKGHTESVKKGTYNASMKALLFYSQAFSLLRPFTEIPECFQIIQEIMKNQANIYAKINDLGNVKRVLEELIHLTRESKGHSLVHPKTRVAVSA
jgi:tetratricopeptide (TPR) repeat protein